MAAMTASNEQGSSLGLTGPRPRLPTLPVSDGRMVMEEFCEKVDNSGTSPERLPVVEIKPFMHQEWRPSCSLPNYYDSAATSMSDSSEWKDSTSGYPDVAGQLSMRNMSKSADFGSRNSLLGGRRENAWPRPKEGKLVDTSHPGMFVTANDREKTTMKEMQATMLGDVGPSTQTASIKRSLSEVQLLRQREMRVYGRRMEDLPPKLSMFYMSPWEYYHINRSYHIPMAGQASIQSMAITNVGAAQQSTGPAQHAATIMHDMECRYQGLENVYIDDNIYDTFDRANTLPSIRVINTKPQKRPWKQLQPLSSPSHMTMSAPGSSKSPIYRLGVANSLDVLRHIGRPALVENHLTMHLKHTLSQLRRTQDPQSALQGLAAGLLQQTMPSGKPAGLRMSGTPTYGETMIRAGIKANNKIDNHNIRAAMPCRSAPNMQSHSTTNVMSEVSAIQEVGEGDDLKQSSKHVRSTVVTDLNDELQPTRVSHSSAEGVVTSRQSQEGEATTPRWGSHGSKSYHRDQDPQEPILLPKGGQGRRSKRSRRRKSRQDHVHSVAESTEKEPCDDTLPTNSSSETATPCRSAGDCSVQLRGSQSMNVDQFNVHAKPNIQDGLREEHESFDKFQPSAEYGREWKSCSTGKGITVEMPQVSAETPGHTASGSALGLVPDGPDHHAETDVIVNSTAGGRKSVNSNKAIGNNRNVIQDESIPPVGPVDEENTANNTNPDRTNVTGNVHDRASLSGDISDEGNFRNEGNTEGCNTEGGKSSSPNATLAAIGTPGGPDGINRNVSRGGPQQLTDTVVEGTDMTVRGQPPSLQEAHTKDTNNTTIDDADGLADFEGINADTASGLSDACSISTTENQQQMNVSEGDAVRDAAEDTGGRIEDVTDSSTLGSGADSAWSAPTMHSGRTTPVSFPLEGDAAINRKMQTKSAASKASSSGYRGDTVYLTSWDQRTECESVRPETVLTVREEPEPEHE